MTRTLEGAGYQYFSKISSFLTVNVVFDWQSTFIQKSIVRMQNLYDANKSLSKQAVILPNVPLTLNAVNQQNTGGQQSTYLPCEYLLTQQKV